METKRYALAIVVFLVVVVTSTTTSSTAVGYTDTASFYGASYVAVPLQDARSTTELQLSFRTRRSDAMLFLAAGRTDYCLVQLETGRLKVHINVGAGEREVASPKGLRLDDLTWHEIVITRKEAAFTLQVDKIHVVKENLPGRFFELNVHFGLFVGGLGDFSELFLGHLEYLRGCLADVRYNGVNVLARARERQGHVDVQGVTWTCATEFDAGIDRQLSFVEDGAFVAMPNLISRTGARWQLDLKTFSPRGLLLYNTGLSTQSDFVALELVDGRVRLLLNKGNGATELLSTVTVSDGRWHSLSLHFSPTYMEIGVDGVAVNLRLPQGGSRFFDLADTVFVGGTELNKRARASGQGVKGALEAFRGCIRDMRVEGRAVGFPDARVTQGVLPDCVWDFPCARQPCVAEATCLQQGVDSFRCEGCGQPLCVKTDYSDSYKVFSKPTLPVDLEVLVLTPLTVAEGDNTLVTVRNVDVVLDYPKYGVRDSGVLLYLVEAPKHGRLEADLWERSANKGLVFTLLDLAKDKIRYLHDGSEQHQDSMTLELELSPDSNFLLPSYLQGRHRFVLHVNVTPVNDPPTLNLLPSKTLRLAQGTRKVLTGEVLHAEDPDSAATDLVYTVLSQGGDGRGHIERGASPVESFTQQDVDRGLVSYVHGGGGGGGGAGAAARLALHVSDGIETSAAAILRVVAFPLQVSLLNNTGIVLTHRSSTRIYPSNLTFTSNAEDPSLEVHYEVVKPPQFGHLQRLRGSASAGGEGQWQTVDHFSSHQLAREQIRYLHTTGTPAHDDFKFKVSVLETQNPTVFDFRVTFAELRLESVGGEELLLNGTRDAALTGAQLGFRTVPLASDPSHVVYRVVTSPRYGALHLQGSKHRRLQPGDTFSQSDVDAGRLRYRLHRKAYSHVRDELRVRASAPDCAPVVATVALQHAPSGETRDAVRATLRRLQVTEGGRRPLLKTHLDLALATPTPVSDLVYNVTHGPRHGRLDVVAVAAAGGTSTPGRENTDYFTSAELTAERVVYVHDDSETRRDAFHFVALSSEEEDFQYVGVFHVDVLLKNDNTPVRAVDKVFHVVAGGERLLTGEDLRYSDADVDTKTSDIVYTRRGIPNGGIYQASDRAVPLFEFSQEDLDERRVVFRHEGDDYGKVGLWITDGQFYANGVLEVRASPPFVAVVNNTGVVVRQAGAAALSRWNLSVETNLDARGDRLLYEVLEGPSHGQLRSGRPGGGVVTRFSQSELDGAALLYQHDGGTHFSDSFRFRVEASTASSASTTASTDGKFAVRVFPASYWEPLVVVANQTLYVEESTSVVLGSATLKVMHPQIPATDIVFWVVEPPQFGYLELESSVDEAGGSGGSGGGVGEFEQALVDEGRLLYVQATPNRSRDGLQLDVTNGVTWLRGLRLQVVVVPERLYLSVAAPLRVDEGGVATLSQGLLGVATDFYRGRVHDFKVTQSPRAGTLRSAAAKDSKVDRFSHAQLVAGNIQYVHDGSESLGDEFTVVGFAGDKKSEPAVVQVLVSAVNDEPPSLRNNTGLSVWEGASVLVTNVELGAVDLDTPAGNLTFTVSSPRGGHVALAAAPSLHVKKFTQAQVNNRQIIFQHTGGDTAGFEVTVSDGARSTSPTNVTVVPCPVSLHVSSSSALSLHVFPMRRQLLTPQHLLALASDHASPRPRPVVFVVVAPPQLGRLVLASASAGADSSASGVANFTQRDVNESRVFYEHTHQFFGLSTNDSFVLDVRADFAEPVLGQVVNVDISVSSGGLDQFLVIPPLEVEEGGSAPVYINTSGVAAFLESRSEVEVACLLLQVAAPLRHGALVIAGDANETVFTQTEMDNGEVVYQHDHSDTTSDELAFTLRLEPGSVVLLNATLGIAVTPVNDAPFHLATPAPSLSVVQGQTTAIGREALLTEDADTAPEDIVYDVISGPSAGRLLLVNASASSVAANESAVRFTQADVDAGQLFYEHVASASSAGSSTTALQPANFYFRVWDGRFNPVYTIFNIHVLPLTLNVSAATPVLLRQGSSVAPVTPRHLAVTTNGRLDDVRFNVTRPPRHGAVYVHGVAAAEFTHGDLDAGRVMYVQMDMTTENDALEVAAWVADAGVAMEGVEVRVRVEPLLEYGNFTPVVGTRNRLGLDALDATPLAKLTSSNPTFQIERRPRLGRIKKIIRSSGEKRGEREREVKQFSHEELKSGVIYYVAKPLPRLDADGAEDSFQFLLVASIFQPARGELRFQVRPDRELVADVSSLPSTPASSSSASSDRVPGPKSPVSRESDLVASPNMSTDYVLIVSMVFGVVVVSVLVIVAVKCHSARRSHAAGGSGKGGGGGGDASKDGPPTLPRPPTASLLHDDLMLPPPPPPLSSSVTSASCGSPPHGKRFINGSPTPLALPSLQCKVIPVGVAGDAVTDVTGDVLDVNTRYPYGAPDDPAEEWSGSDATYPHHHHHHPPPRTTNPMLRRNQYWV